MSLNLEFRYCTALDLAWCKKQRKQWSGFGEWIGEIGCYRPDDDMICLGVTVLYYIWENKGENKLIRALIDTLNHEGIHRAIYQTTHSKCACLRFDLIFYPPFNYKLNREYFKLY